MLVCLMLGLYEAPFDFRQLTTWRVFNDFWQTHSVLLGMPGLGNKPIRTGKTRARD